MRPIWGEGRTVTSKQRNFILETRSLGYIKLSKMYIFGTTFETTRMRINRALNVSTKIGQRIPYLICISLQMPHVYYFVYLNIILLQSTRGRPCEE